MVLTRSDALPYIHTLPLNIPHSALRVQRPVYINFPNARGVADESGHGLGEVLGLQRENLVW